MYACMYVLCMYVYMHQAGKDFSFGIRYNSFAFCDTVVKKEQFLGFKEAQQPSHFKGMKNT